MPEPKGAGRHLYYGLIPASASLVAVFFVLIARKHVAADLLILFLALVMLAEGVGLTINWRGGADEIVNILEVEERPSLLSLMPPIGYRAFGVTLVFIGAASVLEALRFLL